MTMRNFNSNGVKKTKVRRMEWVYYEFARNT